jgi:hypothetical protein
MSAADEPERDLLLGTYVQGTPEGMCLAALDQSAAETAEYREVLLRLDPSVSLPDYALRVSIGRPTRFAGRADIAWAPRARRTMHRGRRA